MVRNFYVFFELNMSNFAEDQYFVKGIELIKSNNSLCN